jgi:hypothetical protein
MQLTPKQKQCIKFLTDQGYNVQLDRNGDVLCAYYWHPELIVSKIDLREFNRQDGYTNE